MKQCFKCRETKIKSEFYRHSRMLDGHLNKCINCTRVENNVRYHASDKEIIRARKNAYNVANKERKAKWSKNYLLKYPDKCAAQCAKRRAYKLNATPKWLTSEQHADITQFYKEAKELQWLSEERLEVDHIIPLVSSVVCGLHVPWNLQILPRSDNVRKGNKVF